MTLIFGSVSFEDYHFFIAVPDIGLSIYKSLKAVMTVTQSFKSPLEISQKLHAGKSSICMTGSQRFIY